MMPFQLLVLCNIDWFRNDELERIWKEPWPILKYCFGIHVKGLRKTTRKPPVRIASLLDEI
jgi:hypothetical protein